MRSKRLLAALRIRAAQNGMNMRFVEEPRTGLIECYWVTGPRRCAWCGSLADAWSVASGKGVVA